LKARAIALSLVLHLTPLALLLYFSVGPLSIVDEKRPEAEAVVDAPIGDVFVTEQAESPGSPENDKQVAESASPPEPRTEFPSEVKTPDEQAGGFPSSPGIPDGEAHPLGKIEPVYPPLSRKLGEEGEAVLALAIDESGRVTEALVEKSSGYERLDEAAKQALLAASFEPARKNGVALASRKNLRIEFRLQNAK
jgi:protein TonB